MGGTRAGAKGKARWDKTTNENTVTVVVICRQTTPSILEWTGATSTETKL